MKILFTGFGTRHVGSDRVQLPVATGAEALAGLLRERHEVDQRAVTPGEDLGGYDAAIVVAIAPNALTARYVLGGLWALHVFGARAHLVIDDWQTSQLVAGAKTQARDHSRIWKELLNRVGRAECLASPALTAAVEGQVHLLAGDGWPWRVWTPLFRYGDPLKLGLPAQRYVPFDPSLFFWEQKRHLQVHAFGEHRERQWVSASLLSKQDWLDRTKFTWPVWRLGNVKQDQPRLSEDMVLRAYGLCWGALSAPHNHAGSGWWRARYQFAALMGAVLLGSHKETSPLGTGYWLWAPAEVESLPDAALAELAQLQRDNFLAQAQPLDELRDVVNSTIEERA